MGSNTKSIARLFPIPQGDHCYRDVCFFKSKKRVRQPSRRSNREAGTIKTECIPNPIDGPP